MSLVPHNYMLLTCTCEPTFVEQYSILPDQVYNCQLQSFAREVSISDHAPSER